MKINKKSPVFVGLGKTLFTSSVCIIDPLQSDFPTLYLLERYSRKKADGAWPELLLSKLEKYLESRRLLICENRDVLTPEEFEDSLDKVLPFYDFLNKKGLAKYTRSFNQEISFLTHHYCHAQVAKYMSPFKKTAVLVIDGAGTEGSDFNETHLEYLKVDKKNFDQHEEVSLYSLDNGEIKSVWKKWHKFEQSRKYPDHYYSTGLGMCYEKVAEFIFSSKQASGKVMGLAAFGKSLKFSSTTDLLNSLDWSRSYKGKSKNDWEQSIEIEYYQDLAASIQELFEKRFESLINEIKESLPDYENLIIVGGCALNCTNNMKIKNSNLFKEIYIPPFPGDESISLGCALHSYYLDNKWKEFSQTNQQGYFGEKLEITKDEIKQVFKGYEILSPECILDFSSDLIESGEVIAWFQGESESGPRALGNRSILSRMDIEGRKEYLNKSVKFRESFRPYGASVIFEKISTYFEVSDNFNNPYMSFAVKVREEFRALFQEATHIDGTSRMQSVRRTQNAYFYDLISKVGEKTGVYGVLNTSLNIMGEPMVETLSDLERFLSESNVHGAVIKNFYIKKK